MMERLTDRLGGRRGIEGEVGPTRSLPWFHKALVVPVLALALIAGGFVSTSEVQASGVCFEWLEPRYGEHDIWKRVCYDCGTGQIYDVVSKGYFHSGGYYFRYYELQYGDCWYQDIDPFGYSSGWQKDIFCR